MNEDELNKKILSNISLENDIVVYKELDELSPQSINIMWDIVDQLTVNHDAFYMVVDLTDSPPPTALQRKLLKERMVKLKHKVKFGAMFTNKNVLINLSIKFLMGGKTIFPNAVFNTQEEAFKAIEKHKSLQDI